MTREVEAQGDGSANLPIEVPLRREWEGLLGVVRHEDGQGVF